MLYYNIIYFYVSYYYFFHFFNYMYLLIIFILFLFICSYFVETHVEKLEVSENNCFNIDPQAEDFYRQLVRDGMMDFEAAHQLLMTLNEVFCLEKELEENDCGAVLLNKGYRQDQHKLLSDREVLENKLVELGIYLDNQVRSLPRRYIGKFEKRLNKLFEVHKRKIISMCSIVKN